VAPTHSDRPQAAEWSISNDPDHPNRPPGGSEFLVISEGAVRIVASAEALSIDCQTALKLIADPHRNHVCESEVHDFTLTERATADRSSNIQREEVGSVIGYLKCLSRAGRLSRCGCQPSFPAPYGSVGQDGTRSAHSHLGITGPDLN